MWQFLLHLGTIGDYDNVTLTCPPPAAGQAAAPLGFYDGTSVANAYNLLGGLSVLAVLLVVTIIYMGTRTSLGPRFVGRWYKGAIAAAIICALLAYITLSFAPTHALADSCETNPTPFPLRLPGSLIIARTLAGLVWGALAYLLFSLILTLTAGKFASGKNGFFHNRGCPWPRFVP